MIVITEAESAAIITPDLAFAAVQDASSPRSRQRPQAFRSWWPMAATRRTGSP